MTRPETSSSRRKIIGLERQRDALDLRLQRYTFEAIGDKLGISKMAAKKSIDKAMQAYRDDIAAKVPELRALESATLDALQQKLMEAVLIQIPISEINAEGVRVERIRTEINMQAVDRVLNIMERRAKMLGLDMPTKIAPTTPGGDEEYQSIAGAARDKLRGLLQARLRGLAAPMPVPQPTGTADPEAAPEETQQQADPPAA